MNKKKVLMTGFATLAMIMTSGSLTGCSQTTQTKTTQSVKKKTTLGKKTKDSKMIKIKNLTEKKITVFETKATSDDDFSENLLSNGDVLSKKETRTLYYEADSDETLSIKVGLKSEDTTYVFDKIDENSEDIEDVSLKLNDDKKVEIEVTKKDDSKVTIQASSNEVKSEDEKKSEEENEETAKNDSSETESKKDSTASSSNKSSEGSSSKSNSTHTHNWVAQTKTIHHDAVTQTQTVVDQEAYDEQVPQYTTESHNFCSDCNQDFHGWSQSAVTQHVKQHALNDENPKGGYHSGLVQVLSGYQTIHHDAVTHQEQVVVQQAYDETVSDGYKCSECGAKK